MKKLLLALAPSLVAGNALAHGMSQADQRALLEGGYLLYAWLGAKHMVTGYDHLLFLFGVIFFLTRPRDVVRCVTAFTLGHSLTLIAGTLFRIGADYYLVDAAIALSVCYKGFDNLDGFRRWLGRASPNLTAVIFGFGLIHGFGLSTRLQQLPLGDDTAGLVLRILSFNGGVELGQCAALLVMVAVLAGWRRTPSFSQFSTLSNGGLVAAGLLLFLVQLHGYGHNRFPDDLGFSAHAHVHHHQQLDLERARQQFSDNLLDAR